MSQGDAIRLLTLIKQKETYVARLRTLLDQAKREKAMDVFAIHSEMKTAIAQGKALVDRYNELARLQKEDREYLLALAKRDEQIALRTIRAHLAQARANKPIQEEQE